MTSSQSHESSRAAWLRAAKWGVFTHYLTPATTSAEAWNEQIDAFDTEGLAEQLAAVGAPYYCMTIGQNSGHYCAPNATYDAIVGIKPSKCSRRDLMSDLYQALEPRGIKLLVYSPAGAPDQDAAAMAALQWTRGPERNAAFQQHWEAVHREWSLRWGHKVVGWWIDGVFWGKAMYGAPEAPNFQSFANALRAGNPDSIVALNPGIGIPIVPQHGADEDYLAGEVDFALPVNGTNPDSDQSAYTPFVDGKLLHVLTFLGEWWGAGMPRFPDELVIGYTKHINANGGAVTWDVPIQPNGLIPKPFLEQLSAIQHALQR